MFDVSVRVYSEFISLSCFRLLTGSGFLMQFYPTAMQPCTPHCSPSGGCLDAVCAGERDASKKTDRYSFGSVQQQHYVRQPQWAHLFATITSSFKNHSPKGVYTHNNTTAFASLTATHACVCVCVCTVIKLRYNNKARAESVQ